MKGSRRLQKKWLTLLQSRCSSLKDEVLNSSMVLAACASITALYPTLQHRLLHYWLISFGSDFSHLTRSGPRQLEDGRNYCKYRAILFNEFENSPAKALKIFDSGAAEADISKCHGTVIPNEWSFQSPYSDPAIIKCYNGIIKIADRIPMRLCGNTLKLDSDRYYACIWLLITYYFVKTHQKRFCYIHVQCTQT